jgi:hypothetical protein
METVKALVVRGVYARKAPDQQVTAHAEGAILELTPLDFAALKASNYVVEAPKEAPKETPKEEVKPAKNVAR